MRGPARRRGQAPIPPETFPRTGLVCQSEFCTHSGQRGIYPLSAKTFDRGVADGLYPPPIVLSAGIRFWRAEDILAICEGRDWRSLPRASEAA